MVGNLHVVSYLLLQGELYHGNPNCGSVTLSTTEAEYIAAIEVDKEMLWMERFLLELGLNKLTYVVFGTV